MPSIELLKTAQISDRIPYANLDNADETSKAMAQVGGEFANFAVKLNDQRKRVESETFITDSKYKYAQELETESNNLRIKYETEAKQNGTSVDYNAYQKDIGDLGLSLREKYADNAPYTDAKDAFLLETVPVYSKNNMSASEYVKNQNLVAGKNAKNLEITTLGQQLYKDPNNTIADIDYLKALENMNDPDLFTPDEVAKMQSQVRKEYRDSKVEGFLSNGNKLGVDGKVHKEMEYYRKGLDFLKSNHDALKDMSPDDRLKAETRLENGLRVAKTNMATHTQAKVSAYVNSNTGDETLGKNLLQEIRSNPSTDNFTKDLLASKVMTEMASVKVASAIGLIPPKDRDVEGYINKTIEGMALQDPYIKGSAKTELAQEIFKRIQLDDQQVKKDPATYFASRDQEISNLSTAILNGDAESFQKMKVSLDKYYDSWGIDVPSRKYLPAPIASHFKESFNNATKTGDYRVAVNVVDTLEKVGGHDTTKLMFESGIDSKYAVLGDFGKLDRPVILQDMVNYDKNYKNRDAVGLKKEDVDTYKKNLIDSNEFNAILNTSGGRGIEYRNALVEAMNAHYVGQKSKGIDFSKKEQAISMLKDKYNFSSFGSSKVYAPKTVDQARLDTFLQNNSGLGVNYVKSFGVFLDKKAGESEEAKNNDLQENAKWVTGRNGLELWKTNTIGKLVPVYSGKDENNLKHITVKWSDVNSYKNFKPPVSERVFGKNKLEEIRLMVRGMK